MAVVPAQNPRPDLLVAHMCKLAVLAVAATLLIELVAHAGLVAATTTTHDASAAPIDSFLLLILSLIHLGLQLAVLALPIRAISSGLTGRLLTASAATNRGPTTAGGSDRAAHRALRALKEAGALVANVLDGKVSIAGDLHTARSNGIDHLLVDRQQITRRQAQPSGAAQLPLKLSNHAAEDLDSRFSRTRNERVLGNALPTRLIHVLD